MKMLKKRVPETFGVEMDVDEFFNLLKAHIASGEEGCIKAVSNDGENEFLIGEGDYFELTKDRRVRITECC